MKEDFPLLNNSDIVYLDSAATSQKPEVVLDSMKYFYSNFNANANRGSYKLSADVSKVFDESRKKIANFINCEDDSSILFTKNATEAANLIAYSYGLNNLTENDEILISIMEHHANIVPWQFVAKMTKAKLKYIYLNNNLDLTLDEIKNTVNQNTKIVCITHMSNVLGNINNVKEISKYIHDNSGASVIVDATQSICHLKIDVCDLDVDFLFFSAHKMFGPTGVGVLYGKKEKLNKMDPFLFGGDMIEYVYEDYSTYSALPNKFEAGTQNVAGVYSLSIAIDYIESVGYEKIHNNDKILTEYAIDELKKLKFIELYIPSGLHSSIISFNVKGVHAHDVSSILDNYNICIRVGHHCAQPLLRFLNLVSTCRISLSIYNTKEDVDKLIISLNKVYDVFKTIIDMEFLNE